MPSPPVSPYTILALAPFAPVPEAGYRARIQDADLNTLDEALAALAPRFWVEVPREACPEGGLSIGVASLPGFKPENIVASTPYLAELDACRRYLAEARTANTAPAEAARQVRERWPAPASLLALDVGAAPASSPAPESAGALDDILSMVAVEASPAATAGSGGTLAGWQAQAEALLSRCLESVLGDPFFRACEAAWRGAQCLAQQASVKAGGPVRLRLCATSGEVLGQALAQLPQTLALDLPHLVLVDFALDNAPARLDLLENVLDFADMLLAPTVVELSPAFFGVAAWEELSRLGYLRAALDDARFARFRKLRGHSGAGKLLCALNRFLVRAPYGPDNPARPAPMRESGPLWLSPVWGVGALAARSVALCGWASRLTDYRNVRLENLAVWDGGQGPAPTQGLLGEERIAELVECGFTPLVSARGDDTAFLPRQAALDGGSFVFQMFFGRVLGQLIDAREATGGQDASQAGRQAIVDLFNATGHTPPPDLVVQAGEQQEGRTMLEIAFTPPGAVMGGERLRFGFGW